VHSDHSTILQVGSADVGKGGGQNWLWTGFTDPSRRRGIWGSTDLRATSIGYKSACISGLLKAETTPTQMEQW
jgi:hypothetical protein